MPVGHVVISIVIFKYYDLLWRILFFLNKIIILCMTKLQYVRVDCMSADQLPAAELHPAAAY